MLRSTTGKVGLGCLAAAGAMLLLSRAPARGQEYCVSCTAPKALYRCVIERAVPTGTPLTTLCAASLARYGSHGACKVTGGTVFDCDGPVRRIDVEAAAEALAAPADQQTNSKRPAARDATSPRPADPGKAVDPINKEAAPKSAEAEPKTVEALARSVAKSSGQAFDHAGTSIGSGASKAWKCIASLFEKC